MTDARKELTKLYAETIARLRALGYTEGELRAGLEGALRACREAVGEESLYYVWNETDRILAHPEPMTRAQCDEFMAAFRQRFAAQGYYAAASGRIPISELQLHLIPKELL